MLDLARRPRREIEVPLDGGASVTVKVLDTIEHDAATIEAGRMIEALGEGAAALGDLGLDVPAMLANPILKAGVSSYVRRVEVACLAIVRWQGIAVDGVVAAEPTRAVIAQMLIDPSRAAKIESAALAFVREVAAEGKGSPLSPGGAARAADTAGAAGSTASPAPSGSEVPTEGSVRSTNIGR